VGVAAGPKVVTEGLVFSLDARNLKTYDEIPGITDHGISDWYCFVSGTATYSAIYPNTEIIEINENGNETVMVSTGSDPQRGTFSTTAGRRYYGTKAIHLLQTTASDNQHELAPVSFAGTYFAHFWSRNSPTTYYAYAPQDDTTLEFFDNNAVGGVTGIVTATYNITKGLTTSFTSTAVNTWQFFKADKPIIMTAGAGGTGSDKTILAPATQYNYKRRNGNNITINNTAPSTSGTYITWDTSLPVATVEIADGAGGDSTQGIGYEYLSDNYSWGNVLSDYQIVAPYADTTVTVSYWANSQWNVGEVHSLNGTQTNPDAVDRDGTNGFGVDGTNISGAAANLASGANLWKFEGTQPFSVIINDTADDEERLLGWMSNKTLRTSSNVTQSFVNLIDKDDRSRMKIYGKDLTTTVEYAGAKLSGADYIEFDGVDDYVSLSQNITLDFNRTFFFYISALPSTGTYHLLNSVSIGGFQNRISITRTGLNFYRGDNGSTDLVSRNFTGGSQENRFFAILTDNTNLYTIEPGMTSLPAGSSLNSLPNGPRSFDSIGYQSTGSGWVYFNGKIPYFTYYNRSLSLAEIQQNFNATRGRFGI
jgi:hypothetical protein